MIENDTIRLLRECDAGIRMGVDAIDSVLSHVSSPLMKKELSHSRDEHEELAGKLEAALRRFHDDGKEPSLIATSMAHMKTNFKLGLHDTDATAAELISDGCHMGVKSLSRYMRQYKAADHDSKAIAVDLIQIEDHLGKEMRAFL